MQPTLEALESRAIPSALLPNTESLASFKQAYPGAVFQPTPGFVTVAELAVSPGADANILPGEREILHGWFVKDPRLAANNGWLIQDQQDGVVNPLPAAAPAAGHLSAPAPSDEQAVDFLMALDGHKPGEQ